LIDGRHSRLEDSFDEDEYKKGLKMQINLSWRAYNLKLVQMFKQLHIWSSFLQPKRVEKPIFKG